MAIPELKKPNSKKPDLKAVGSSPGDRDGAGQPQAVQTSQTPANAEAPAVTREAEAKSPPAATAEHAKPLRKRLILMTAGSLAILAAGYFGYQYWTVGRFIVSTDDAYVGVNMSNVAPKIAAHVIKVPVTDNQQVKAGDVLVQLDDGDYKLAAEQAAAKLATQKSTLNTIDAQIKAAEATAAQARAQLDASTASLVKAEADFYRTSELAKNEYSSKASLDAARAARDSAKAGLSAQKAAIQSAEANVAVLQAQREDAGRVVKELEVAVAKAGRDLSFTTIRAPLDGVVGNRSVQVGDYVSPGKRLMAVVPLDLVYVDANLKETQLGRIAAGETAKVRVDALGGKTLEGTVVSVAPASGSQFSLLPPENATGNFTKIVQRVPVRIAVPTSEAQGRLRPGLSVVVDIDTRETAKK